MTVAVRGLSLMKCKSVETALTTARRVLTIASSAMVIGSILIHQLQAQVLHLRQRRLPRHHQQMVAAHGPSLRKCKSVETALNTAWRVLTIASSAMVIGFILHWW